MPYNGHRWGGRQNNNFCCNACRDLDYMPICATKEMQKMTAHIHFGLSLSSKGRLTKISSNSRFARGSRFTTPHQPLTSLKVVGKPRFY